MNGRQRLASNALVAMLNVVVGSVVLFLLYRFMLHTLGAQAVGAWSLIVASVGVARLSELGVAASVTRFVAAARARNQPREAADVIETAFTTLLVLGAAAATLVGLAGHSVLEHLLPAEQLSAGLQALPWALASLVTGLASGAILSALDGCQRVDLRVAALLGGQFVFLAGAWVLAPAHGLAGVAAAQLLQALVTLLCAWLLLRSQLTMPGALPLRWRAPVFGRIWSYSALFQLNNLMVVVLDPAIKVMISRLGGLEATAYFDMATQLIQRLRQLIVAASQVLVPAIAEAHEAGTRYVRELYESSYRTVFAATVPIFCLFVALVPAISVLWIGHEEPLFTGIAWICIAGLALNTIGTPSYFSNLGTGAVVMNTAGHVINTVLALVAGWICGQAAGAYGVSAGYVSGLAAGGLFIQLRFMRRHAIPLAMLLPAESRSLLVACLAAMAGCRMADHLLAASGGFDGPEPGPQLLRLAAMLLLFALISSPAVWSHPLRRNLGMRLRSLLA